MTATTNDYYCLKSEYYIYFYYNETLTNYKLDRRRGFKPTDGCVGSSSSNNSDYGYCVKNNNKEADGIDGGNGIEESGSKHTSVFLCSTCVKNNGYLNIYHIKIHDLVPNFNCLIKNKIIYCYLCKNSLFTVKPMSQCISCFRARVKSVQTVCIQSTKKTYLETWNSPQQQQQLISNSLSSTLSPSSLASGSSGSSSSVYLNDGKKYSYFSNRFIPQPINVVTCAVTENSSGFKRLPATLINSTTMTTKITNPITSHIPLSTTTTTTASQDYNIVKPSNDDD
jgi:hypothetical protein